MKNITIVAKTSIETAVKLQNAINLGFDASIDINPANDVKVKNDLFVYTSRTEGEKIVETIIISSEALVKIIRIIGNFYCTVKPLIITTQNIFKGMGDQFKNVIGKTCTIVNGRKRKQPVTRTRHTNITTGDGTKIDTRISVTSFSDEVALAAIDAEFDKLGYHK